MMLRPAPTLDRGKRLRAQEGENQSWDETHQHKAHHMGREGRVVSDRCAVLVHTLVTAVRREMDCHIGSEENRFLSMPRLRRGYHPCRPLGMRLVRVRL